MPTAPLIVHDRISVIARSLNLSSLLLSARWTIFRESKKTEKDNRQIMFRINASLADIKSH
jgi:hypothetical protein